MKKQEKTTPMDTLKERLRNADDKTLINRFHNYPLKSLILNMISLALFITAFTMEEMKLFLFLCLGAISIIIFQIIVPPYFKRAVAQVMMERYRTEKDEHVDEFYYYYRREIEVLGKVKKSVPEMIFKIIGLVVKIINVLFNLLTAVALLMISLGVAVILGGGLWFFNFCLGGSRPVLELAIACTVPAKWAYAFLLRVLSLKDYIGLGEKTYDESYFVSKEPKEESQGLANASLRDYISSPNVYLGACNLTGVYTVFHNTINYKGTLTAPRISHHDNIDLSRSIDSAIEEVKKDFERQLEKFYRDHPNASKVKVEVRIDGYITD